MPDQPAQEGQQWRADWNHVQTSYSGRMRCTLHGPHGSYDLDNREQVAALVADLTSTRTAANGHDRGAWLADFVKAILHGDDEHRSWLIEAGGAYANGRPVPAPRGTNAQPDTAANGLREKAELFDRMAPFFDQVDLVGTRGPAGSAKERRRREEEEHEYAAVVEAVYALLEAEALTTTQSLSGGEG